MVTSFLIFALFSMTYTLQKSKFLFVCTTWEMVDEFPDANETMMLVAEDLLEKFGTQNDGYVLQFYMSVMAKHINI